MLWEGLLLDVDPLRKERRTRKGCKVLGHPSLVRPRNSSLTRVRRNASTARSRDTERETILSILSLWIRTGREKSKLLLDKVIMITPCNFSIYDSTTWILDIEVLLIFIIRCRVCRSVEYLKKVKDSSILEMEDPF